VGTAVGIAIAFGLGPWVLLGAYMYLGPYLKPWLQGLAERAKAWQQQAAQEARADAAEAENEGDDDADADAEAPTAALSGGPMRFSRVTNLSSSDSDNY
jgi:type II secretory pathway component PulM